MPHSNRKQPLLFDALGSNRFPCLSFLWRLRPFRPWPALLMPKVPKTGVRIFMLGGGGCYVEGRCHLEQNLSLDNLGEKLPRATLLALASSVGICLAGTRLRALSFQMRLGKQHDLGDLC